MSGFEKFTIDRFEGDYAVLENSNGDMSNVPREQIDSQAKEGWHVCFDGDKYIVNDVNLHEININDQKNSIKNRFEKLKKR